MNPVIDSTDTFESSDHDEPRTRLTPSDLRGLLIVAGCGSVTAFALLLSSMQSMPAWLIGQGLLALALTQWFILLHEAGHLTLFRARALNVIAGHIAGFFALIPFASWRRVHGLHHRWTGWQDLDPTTAPLVPRERSALERKAVDVAWRYWLPLFSVVYRLSNYWNVRRLAHFFREAKQRRAMVFNAALVLVGYAALFSWLGAWQSITLVGVATLISLALQDPLILSQHTHIPQNISGGERVAPLTPRAQERYTRSLKCPRWFAQWVLVNFNAHELHHRFPGVPGYRLAEMEHQPANEVDWWRWLRGAKRLRGSELVFETRDRTGFML